MRKKELFLITLLIFIGFGCFAFYKKYEAQKQGEIHVFIEFTTNAALLSMVDFVKLSPNTPKIVAWGRFPDIKKRVDLSKYMAKEVKCSSDVIMKAVKKELQKHPEYKVIFYTSVDHFNVSILPTLESIPPKNVGHIHLYEEGHGALAVNKKSYYLHHDYEFDNLPKTPILRSYAYYTHLKYPTTYHLGFVSYMQKNDEFQKLMTLLRKADVQNVDFYEIAKSLTDKQINSLIELVGVDKMVLDAVSAQTDKPTAILVGSWIDHPSKSAFLYKQLVEALKNKDFNWIYKPHPSPDSEEMTAQIKKDFPNLVVIPSNIPIELFLFAGVMPRYIAGAFSSIFLTLPNHQILFYIKRFDGDAALPFLLEQDIITQKQVIEMPPLESDIEGKQP